jgi:hypothetical protein
MRAPCEDCGRDTEPLTKRGDPVFKEWDFYLVLDDLWKWRGWRTASCVRPASKSAWGGRSKRTTTSFARSESTRTGYRWLPAPSTLRRSE